VDALKIIILVSQFCAATLPPEQCFRQYILAGLVKD